eukprot:scaffold455322_cov14-Prasinocladus_malaysianus.AAC.1
MMPNLLMQCHNTHLKPDTFIISLDGCDCSSMVSWQGCRNILSHHSPRRFSRSELRLVWCGRKAEMTPAEQSLAAVEMET